MHRTPRTLTASLLFVATLLVACVSCQKSRSPAATDRLKPGSPAPADGQKPVPQSPVEPMKLNPTMPPASPCQRLTIGTTLGRGEFLTIRMNGLTFNEKRSNIEYNVYGEVIAFDFDFLSGSSSEHFVGKAKMERDITGRITSYKVLVNGTTCTWP